MSLRKRGLVSGAVLLTGALALAACSGGSSTSGSSGGTGGTYSIGQPDAPTLAPSNCYDLYCANIDNIIFTGLYEFQTEGDTMKAVPTELLSSVETKDNGKTYTLTLNPGSKFTNGEAVTAKTFVDTWNFTANGGNGQQLGFVFGPSQLNVEGYDKVAGENSTDGVMSGLKAVDDTTIQMSLVEPLGQPLFENFLAGPQIFPMPSEAFKDIKAYNKQPIGNGPYKLSTPYSDTGLTAVKNPDFTGTAGSADQIDFKFYTDDNAMWADLQANAVDVVYNLPVDFLSQYEAILGDRYINLPGMSFSYEAYPTQAAEFKNRDVRVALAKAVDWNEINSKLYYGTRTVAGSFGPPTVPGGGTDICGSDCTFDAAGAKALLEKAGGIPGNKVEIASSKDQSQTAAEAECNQIQKNLGVECSIKLFPSFAKMIEGYQAIKEGDPGFILALGWGADNPTLQNMIAPIFGSDAGSNYTGYSNPKFDDLIAKGNQANSEDAAVTDWQDAEKVIYSDFAGHATQWRNNVGGYSTNVSNVLINPGGFVNAAEITVNAG